MVISQELLSVVQFFIGDLVLLTQHPEFVIFDLEIEVVVLVEECFVTALVSAHISVAQLIVPDCFLLVLKNINVADDFFLLGHHRRLHLGCHTAVPH